MSKGRTKEVRRRLAEAGDGQRQQEREAIKQKRHEKVGGSGGIHTALGSRAANETLSLAGRRGLAASSLRTPASRSPTAGAA